MLCKPEVEFSAIYATVVSKLHPMFKQMH